MTNGTHGFKSTGIPESKCGGCGKPNDAATFAGQDKIRPKPDDISICLTCGHISAFDEHLRLRNLTSDEMHLVAGSPAILRIQRARALALKVKK